MFFQLNYMPVLKSGCPLGSAVRLIDGTKLILLEYILKKTRRKAEACRLCRFIITMVQYIHTRATSSSTRTQQNSGGPDSTPSQATHVSSTSDPWDVRKGTRT